MKKYQAGDNVSYGVYSSFWPPEMHFVGADGEALEGKSGVTYRRVPLPLVIMAGPAIGGLFVMAFPLVIFAAIAYSIFRLVAQKVKAGANERAFLARANWQPQASYLKKPTEPTEDEVAIESELLDLDERINERRREEK